MEEERKMKKTINIFYAICVLGAMIFASCASDDLTDCGCYDQDKLSLQISVPKSKVVTRATEPGVGNENSINSLKLFFFEGETQKYSADVTTPLTEATDILQAIEADKQNLFEGNVDYVVYAVANLTDDLSGKTLTQFKEHIITKAIGSTTDGDFVMWAKVTPPAKLKLKSADNRIGTFEMKRAAVKVRMKLTAFNLSGYSAGQPTIVLKNVTNKTYLEKADVPAGTNFTNTTEVNLAFGATSDPFYSYPNFWESNPDNATFIYLKVPLTKVGQTTTKDYFYKVPLNGDNKSILANHLYEVTVTVNKLGSLDPETPQPIDAFFSVKDWADKDLSSEIKAAHYLIVAETYAEMKNINLYHIDYRTSDPVQITNVKGQFIYVNNTTGNEVTENTTGDQIPHVTLVEGNKIKIDSKIPVNYIPKKITFTVKHITDTGIDPVNVTVWQYPATFITNTTGTASSLRPTGQFGYGEDHLKNKAIYRITSLIPNLSNFPEPISNYVIGYPTVSTKEFYQGNNTVRFTDNYLTADNEETANMISPNFELASQLGASTVMPYVENNGYSRWQAIYYYFYWGNLRFTYTEQDGKPYGATFNCAKYTETRKENGVDVVLDDWRLPTRAEIQLIDQMQKQGTAVKNIMTGKYYWSGRSNAAILITLPGANDGTPSSAFVRCVRDVKE